MSPSATDSPSSAPKRSANKVVKSAKEAPAKRGRKKKIVESPAKEESPKEAEPLEKTGYVTSVNSLPVDMPLKSEDSIEDEQKMGDLAEEAKPIEDLDDWLDLQFEA